MTPMPSMVSAADRLLILRLGEHLQRTDMVGDEIVDRLYVSLCGSPAPALRGLHLACAERSPFGVAIGRLAASLGGERLLGALGGRGSPPAARPSAARSPRTCRARPLPRHRIGTDARSSSMSLISMRVRCSDAPIVASTTLEQAVIQFVALDGLVRGQVDQFAVDLHGEVGMAVKS